jgi:hypothetical protein
MKEQYQVKISNWFAVLENLDYKVDINRARKNIRQNIDVSTKDSLGHYDLKQHKPWSDTECSKLLDRRKQAKL